MRNLNVSKGLVKNARVIIDELHTHVVKVRLLRENVDPTSPSPFQESEHFIPRISFSFKPSQLPFTLLRRQFPLRLAYACTFNSCQGLTLSKAIIDLRVNVFAHGQLYTALSRVRNRADIASLQVDDNQFSPNKVFPSLLLDDR